MRKAGMVVNEKGAQLSAYHRMTPFLQEHKCKN